MFRLFRNEVKEIIDLTKENAELNRGVADMIMAFNEARHGRKHVSVKNNIPLMSLCLKDLYDLIDENNKLKEQLK